jgi:hypothetical protein
MGNNLFISYDLIQPGQNYENVISEIKKIGGWAKVHYSLWYVKSQLSAQEATDRIWKVMDRNDKLIVIDASNNTASWYNLDKEVEQFIKDQWNK